MIYVFMQYVVYIYICITYIYIYVSMYISEHIRTSQDGFPESVGAPRKWRQDHNLTGHPAGWSSMLGLPWHWMLD